jgi:Fe-Mn family superoxide dismutase
MAFTLPPLPYPTDALAPHISQQTLELHHGKHHQTYVDKLNELTDGEHTNEGLDALVRDATGALLDNAGQHWNHTFYWASMSPDGGGAPTGALADALSSAFGSVDAALKELHDTAATHFGSGWAWLVHDGSAIEVMATHDGDLPLKHGLHALLAIDVWEHAYYLDYQNKRPDYVTAFVDELAAWDVVADRLAEVERP